MSLLLPLLMLSSALTAGIDARAQFDPDTEQLSVRYCNVERGPLILSGKRAARAHLVRMVPAPTHDDGDRLDWLLAAPGCVELVHDLGRIADTRREGVGWRVDSDLLAYADTWWWQPDAQAATPLHLQLPGGWSLSAPWARCAKSDSCRMVPAEPADQPTLTVFGPFATRSTQAGGAVVDTAVVGRVTPTQAQTRLGLGARAAELIAQAYGTLPTPQLQLVIVPWSRSSQPVAFGQINRGGLGGVQLFMAADASSDELAEDWVLPHELAHLLHPYLGSGRGRWLSEGLASYYQNVLRARAGLIEPDAAWQKLFEGFERGRQARAVGSLDQAARRGGAYMRIYWAGAAYWLDADLALRAQGHPGLDALLGQFAARHLPSTRDWSPAEFLGALDAQLLSAGGSAWFVPHAAHAGSTTGFPALGAALAVLGLDWDGQHLTPRGTHAAPIAAAIMARRRTPERTTSAR